MRRLITGFGLILAILASLANISPASAASPLSVTAPASITGGKSLPLVIRLPKAAKSTTTVMLSSSDRAAAPIAATTQIRSGQSTARVLVRTASMESPRSITFTVEVGETERSVEVTVLPAKLTSLSIPTAIVGGSAGRGTVRRDVSSAFPTTITLTSKDPSMVSVPATVTIKANAASASFAVTTTSGATGSVVISASAGGTTVTDSTKVTAPQLSRISLTASLSANSTRTAKVYLTGPAPAGGLTVALSSSDGATLAIPASVTVGQGQLEGAFSIVAGSPDVTTKVTVTARLNGLSMSRSTTVAAGSRPIAVASIDGVPAEMVSGDATSGATVALTKSGTTSTTIQLSSDTPLVVGVPASVIVPAGATSASFTLSTSGVTRPTTVAVIAKLPSGSKQVTVTVLPAALVGVATDAELPSNGVATGTVTLAGIAPEGAVVALTSSEPKLVQVPESLTLGAGATGATFAVTTGAAGEAIKYEIVATYADQTVSFTGVLLPIAPVGPAAFDPSSFTYLPDTETALTLVLTGPAPADGLTVGLEYSEGVSGEDKAWVEPGATSVTVIVWVKSGVGAVSVIAYANDMKAVAEGSVAETTATLALERTELTGGETIVATLTLSAPAGPEGLTVVIASDNPKLVAETKVYVGPGESAVTFKIETRASKKTSTVTLATVEGPAASATVTILPTK